MCTAACPYNGSERRRANDYRAAAEEHRRRLEAALREQRSLVRRLGEAERSHSGARAARLAARRAAVEEELWSEEAGRRFAEQQEELVGLREQVTVLQAQLDASLPADAGENYEAAIQELQAQVTLHETRARLHSGVTSANEAGSIISSGAMGSSIDAACGTWLLESFTEGGACYLWERSTGRVFTDAPDGHWPRPVGVKSTIAPSQRLIAPAQVHICIQPCRCGGRWVRIAAMHHTILTTLSGTCAAPQG